MVTFSKKPIVFGQGQKEPVVVRSISDIPAPKKGGGKPKFERPMTPAERQRLYRARKNGEVK
jgi:hypothetical protein